LLDNTNLLKFIQESLSETTYDVMVKMYDRECAGCTFNSIKVVRNKRIINRGHNIQDAIRICLDIEGSRIIRACGYDDVEHSLQEIITNTCRLWDNTERDEGEFIEVEKVEDLKLDHWMDLAFLLKGGQ